MLSLYDVIVALDLQVHDRGAPSLQETVTGVSIDTRTLQPGNIFVAIQGVQQDGHIYIQEALQKGAKAVIISNIDYAPQHATYFLVPDTAKALDRLGMAFRIRANFDMKCIAITGSVGKTTVKEFLKSVLQHFGPTVASPKSYNNHFGVPLSLCDLKKDTQYGVFEIGMNHTGEIAPLSCMVAPHIAVITAIEAAHIGNMGSLENIAKEKSDIIWGLQENGVVITTADTPYLHVIYEKAKTKQAKVLTVGRDQAATYRLINVQFNEKGMTITATINGEEQSWHMNAFGEHYAMLALFVIAISDSLGIPYENIKTFIEALNPLPRRGEVKELPLQKGGCITVIDDSYNANIASMKAGLSVLDQIKGNRKIAILGQLGELDQFSQSIHADLGDLLNKMNLDYVFAAGEDMQHTYQALNNKDKAFYGATIETLIPKVVETLEPNDVLFIKGSNANKLWMVLESI